MTKVICDICGKDVYGFNSGDGVAKVTNQEKQVKLECRVVQWGTFPKRDLCRLCFNEAAEETLKVVNDDDIPF